LFVIPSVDSHTVTLLIRHIHVLCLHTQGSAYRMNKDMPKVGFELTISAFEQTYTTDASNGAATETGLFSLLLLKLN
jgi:hypothetical protein